MVAIFTNLVTESENSESKDASSTISVDLTKELGSSFGFCHVCKRTDLAFSLSFSSFSARLPFFIEIFAKV